MLVSILIPAFNAERWIGECIRSALRQTHRPVEILVADDGSEDRTAAIIKEFEPMVTLLRGAHQGGNAARNLLLSRAKGEWIQYLDADDCLLPDKIETQLQKLTQRADIDVICSPVIVRDEGSGIEAPLLFMPQLDIILEFLRWGALNTNGFLFRRTALTHVGGWKETQTACQEHELLLRLLQSGYRAVCLEHLSAIYRFHGTSTVSRRDPLKTARLQSELLDLIQQWLESSKRLTAGYKKALYTTRMETARKTWEVDPVFASKLAKRAQLVGAPWSVSSRALPLSYRFAHRVFGFSAAEHLASRQRHLSSFLSSRRNH